MRCLGVAGNMFQPSISRYFHGISWYLMVFSIGILMVFWCVLAHLYAIFQRIGPRRCWASALVKGDGLTRQRQIRRWRRCLWCLRRITWRISPGNECLIVVNSDGYWYQIMTLTDNYIYMIYTSHRYYDTYITNILIIWYIYTYTSHRYYDIVMIIMIIVIDNKPHITHRYWWDDPDDPPRKWAPERVFSAGCNNKIRRFHDRYPPVN